ncbi:MAG: hypothetical protein ABGZ53_20860 [Fuerstiella sp.]
MRNSAIVSCLAVVAWIVSQWWGVWLNVPWIGYGAQITVENRGWAAANDILRDAPQVVPGTGMLFFDAYYSQMVNPFLFERPLLVLPESRPNYFLFPGCVIRRNPAPGIYGSLSIRHYLTISLFTAFNIVLHFIYRKRPEAEPCEA